MCVYAHSLSVTVLGTHFGVPGYTNLVWCVLVVEAVGSREAGIHVGRAKTGIHESQEALLQVLTLLGEGFGLFSDALATFLGKYRRDTRHF